MNRRHGAGGGGWPGQGNKRGRVAKREQLVRSDADGPVDESGMRQRHPPHLRGKEIGLWYAHNSKKKREDKEDSRRQVITIGKSMQRELEELLADVTDATNRKATRPGVFERLYSTHMSESRNAEMDSGVSSRRVNRNEELDRARFRDFEEKSKKGSYLKLLSDREKLPVFKYKDAILNAVSSNQVTVISGETGCGKTTQVPQFILDSFIKAGNASQCRIICTQPRRISAISVAERVADERIERCGESSVGYHIRLEHKLPSSSGSILFCTTGVVLKFMESNEQLSDTTHMIMDEVHERDLFSDILMILMKGVMMKRPDFKLILMSATLNAERFSEYFGNCPIIKVPGFTYPVQEFFLEDVLEMTRYEVSGKGKAKEPVWLKHKLKNTPEYQEQQQDLKMKEVYLRSLRGKYSPKTIETVTQLDEEKLDIELVACLVKHICLNESDGAILVFLPGWVDIDKVNKTLRGSPFFNSRIHLILPLHSLMPTVNQKEVFLRPPRGVRKIILSTQIAETSITIEDVVYVIDSGKLKLGRYNANTNIGTLLPEWVSVANSRQRRGRAGRVKPGICYHLYTKLRESMLEPYQLPEIMRVRLEELCLQIKILKLGKVEPFVEKALDPPEEKAVSAALQLLKRLNALDADENLTPLGYHLARMPLDPQIGKMILFAAMFSCLDPVLTIVSILSFKDPFVMPLGMEREVDQVRLAMSDGSKSDLLMFTRAYQEWENAIEMDNERYFCHENFLSYNNLKMIRDMRRQLAEMLHEVQFTKDSNPKNPAVNRNSENRQVVRAVICAGLYPNVVKVAKGAVAVPGRQPMKLESLEGPCFFHLKSVNDKERFFESPWMVFHHRVKSSKVYLHDSTMVYPLSLLLFGGKLNFTNDSGYDTMVIDEWIKFHCQRDTAKFATDLRKGLDVILDHRIQHPEAWSQTGKGHGTEVLDAIVQLITTEKAKTPNLNNPSTSAS